MDEYKRVSCHFYDVLETAAVKKTLSKIVYIEDDKEKEIEQKEIEQKVIDFKIIDKAEYMILDNSQKIRLDKIVLFNNMNPFA